MAATGEMVKIACQLLPDTVTLVPEREGEVTTEGGLDVIGRTKKISGAIQDLKKAGRQVSLFVDPDPDQIQKSASLGATLIEINTAAYTKRKTVSRVIQKICRYCRFFWFRSLSLLF